MRSLSLAAVAATSLFAFIGFAQAAFVDAPARGWVAHKEGVSARASVTDESAYYIVRLKDAPAAMYQGGISGYAATNPRVAGAPILDVSAPATQGYAAYLADRQDETLGAAQQLLGRFLAPRFSYRYALNGMSLRLNRA
ncbi:MAG TPA: hypothetical protein VKT74_08470, partial [Gammaproteobacteria bacterium]|nr:hypothetical protein [Gammaproteobacteria bacterium]